MLLVADSTKVIYAAPMKSNPIKQWRAENGVSQVELARRLGVSQALVSHYECNGAPDSISALRKISAVTGLPIDAIKPQ